MYPRQTAENQKPAAVPRARIIAFLDGRNWQVDDDIRGVVKWPPNPNQASFLERKLSSPEKYCVKPFYGSYLEKYATLDGVQATVMASLPKGSAGTTTWYAAELGCAQLKSTMTQVRPDGSFRLVNEREFVSLKLGEPDASLFVVPGSYAKLTPSEALKEEAEHDHTALDPQMQKRARRMDAIYAQRTAHTH